MENAILQAVLMKINKEKSQAVSSSARSCNPGSPSAS
jgi:hypothetical protein